MTFRASERSPALRFASDLLTMFVGGGVSVSFALLCLVCGCASVLDIDADPTVKSPVDASTTSPASDGGTGGTSDGAPAKKQRVFVTRGVYTGDLKTAGTSTTGPGGADALCNASALAAKLGGTWKAFVVDRDLAVFDRVRASGGPWYLVDETTLVFPGRSNLWGNPAAAIDVDESRGRVTGGERVWTGTTKCGSCNIWVSGVTSGGDLGGGGYGLVGSTSNTWSNAGVCSTCNIQAHLYCFEE